MLAVSITSGISIRVKKKKAEARRDAQSRVKAGAASEGPHSKRGGQPGQKNGREDNRNASGPVRCAEDFVRLGNHPVDERGFLEVRNAVEPRCNPVSRDKHVTRDLRLDRVHIVHQRRRRNHAARIDRGGNQQNYNVELKAGSIDRRGVLAVALV